MHYTKELKKGKVNLLFTRNFYSVTACRQITSNAAKELALSIDRKQPDIF